MIDDSDRIQSFERLDSFESVLFEVERSLKLGGDPVAQIHVLFREAHNLKSGLALMGFKTCSTLMHDAESSLDAMRSGRLSMSHEMVDAFFEIIDETKRSLSENSDCGKGAEKAREALSFATSIVNTIPRGAYSPIEAEGGLGMDAREPPSQERLKEIPVDKTARLGLNATEYAAAIESINLGYELYVLDKMIDPRLAKADLQSLPIIECIESLGQILARRIFPSGDTDAILSLLFATRLEEEEISLSVFDPCYRTGITVLKANTSIVEERQTASVQEILGADAKPKSRHKKSGVIGSGNYSTLYHSRAQRLPRILLVDDEATSLFILQHYASSYGRVFSATDGPEALSKFSEALAHQPFDAVFLDIMLPSASGHDVLAEMRRLELEAGIDPGSGAKIAMSSALSDYESICESFQKQADAYLMKPFIMENVEAIFSKLGLSRLIPEDNGKTAKDKILGED